MVDNTDLQFRFSGGLANTTSTDSLGGYMSTAATGKISSATPNNFFSTVPLTELSAGEDYYLCFYAYNAHATETMGEAKIWLPTDTLPDDTEVKWSFDSATYAHKYQYAPFMNFDGSTDKVSIAHSSDLQLTDFSVACWFRTTVTPASRLQLVNKGGHGVDTSGNNLNYGIWMDDVSAGYIGAGFEEADGTNHYISSTSAYNDGLWHFVVVTYDDALGSNNLKLYIDGNTTPVAQASTTTTPETTSNNLCIGVNSYGEADEFFTGDIDEVRVWNVGLTSTEMSDLYTAGTVPQESAIVYENKFGEDKGFLIAQSIADINTEPSGMSWTAATSTPPTTPNIGNLAPGEAQAIWTWWHVDSHTTATQDDASRKDDNCIFQGSFKITTVGSGSTGGGDSGGGNPIPATDYTVTAVGDWGCTTMTNTIVDLINDDIDPDVVLGLGDGSYDNSSVSCFISRVTKLKTGRIFKSAYGNHDVDKSTKKNDLINFFVDQRTYYTITYQNLWILVMDTESSFSSGSAQHTFVSGALTDAAADASIDWKIAIMHRPWVGGSSDHPYNEGNILNTYLPLFDTAKVDLILTGHNHNMQRTYPIKSAGGSSVTKTDSTTGPYTQGVGRIHVVCGTGGHDSGNSLYSVGSYSNNAYSNDTDNGVLKIEISNSGQTMTCTLIDDANSSLHSWIINR